MLSIASLPPNANADTRHGDYRIKIIHLSYYQSFEYFLFFSIFAIFCYSVHFEISFSFVPLHPQKTKENQFHMSFGGQNGDKRRQKSVL